MIRFLRRNKLLVKTTLFFFVTMVCYRPVYGQNDRIDKLSVNAAQQSAAPVPVRYVTPEQMQQIVVYSQAQGYVVQEGTFQQLAELEQATQLPEPLLENVKKESECPPEKEKFQQQSANSDKKQSSKAETKESADKLKDCAPKKESTEGSVPERMAVPMPDLPPPGTPEPVPPPAPQPQPQVHTSVGLNVDLSYGHHGGGGGDSSKVFFIVAGIMVIAAFVVYAGKYVADLASGKDYKTWWEFVFTNTYLSTNSGQHGRLNGLKVGTGFVSSDLIQVALIGELGNTSIDVILDEYNNPTPLDFSATYWMLGATARLHLTDKLVNASYLYLDLMGGKTSHGATDTIGIARLGASFGINDYLRLGASIGSFYLGLDEDQGFVNGSDDYWTTLGFEMAVRF